MIMLSDGRPQDHEYGKDRTEKAYAIHDTRQALLEAKHKGITPFLLTVDKDGHDYLQEMCDDIGYEIVSDIDSLPRAVSEMLRWWTPVMNFRRTAKINTILGGENISANEKVVTSFISANYDEKVFPSPHSFDVTRKSNNHLSFGSSLL